MLKAGLLPAPIILPQQYDAIGSKLKIDSNTLIEIRSDTPGTKIYFTVDGTKPTPFQTGRTGKQSTIKYIGAFRLQPGNRVVKAIAVSRDKLRESQTSTKYIDVYPEYEYPNNEETYYNAPLSSSQNSNLKKSNNSLASKNEFYTPYNNDSRPSSRSSSLRRSNSNPDLQGSIEGPINPTNYSGTQINIWGFPPVDIGQLVDGSNGSTRSNMGYMTEQMINRLQTPRYPQLEYPPKQVIKEIEPFSNSEKFNAFCKQLQKLYESDDDFRSGLDQMVENAALNSASITEKDDSFIVGLYCNKYRPTISKPKPKPIPIRPVNNQNFRPINNKTPSPPPRSPSPILKPIVPVKQPEFDDKPKPKPEPAPPKEPEIYREELQQQGTLVPAPKFNPELDCEALKYAVKGLGTKEDIIINIMGNRSNDQRMAIKDLYKTMFGKEVVDDLKGDTSGNFKRLLVALCMAPVEFDCVEMRKAIQGLGTDDSVLIELLTSRSNKRLKEMSSLYTKLYKKKMEDDIAGDTSGDYRKLLMSLTSANRPETTEFDMTLVRKDVDELIAAGIKKRGTDEQKFNTIFGIRSFAHLRALFDEYRSKTGKNIEDSIKSEMSGNLAKTYLALINNIRNRPAYFAKEIKKAVKGLGTDEHTLNRIFVSRCEVDMIQIKEEYQKLYKTTLEKDVADDVSGDYGALLLLLAKDPSRRTYDPINIGGKKDKDKYIMPSTTEPHVTKEVEEPKIEENPTLLPYDGFNPNEDCERLRKAMKGLGTDEKTIISIICKRSNQQRLQLLPLYKQMFGKDLIKELHGELSGHFRDTILGLMMSPAEFDAWSFNKAIKGAGTDEDCLIELLTTRSNEQITAAKEAYRQLFNTDLEKDIRDDTSGDFRKTMVALITAKRPTGNIVDLTVAEADAQNLITAGVKKLGTDESRFIVILCSRSYAQLRATFEEYEKRAGKSLENDIASEFSGDMKNSLLAIIQCIKDRQAYFASLLHKAMKGLGTKDDTVVRIVVSRCEVDMVQIKQKFQAIAKQSLVEWLKGDLSGDYLRSILTLIGEESSIKK